MSVHVRAASLASAGAALPARRWVADVAADDLVAEQRHRELGIVIHLHLLCLISEARG